mmetsp:Transcript_26143/g.52560  ORF Transcript_26143/g.52560 Transcript_26143/m.52560 type:complete len:233 (+) Transcript_26143:674-1372(+)
MIITSEAAQKGWQRGRFPSNFVVFNNYPSIHIPRVIHRALKLFEQLLLASTKRRLPRRQLILNVAIRIKVLRIKRILNLGDPWSSNLLLQELLSADSFKPGMFTNIHVTTCKASETVGLTTNDKTLDQVFSAIVDDATFGEGVLCLYNAFEEADLINSISHERSASTKHFVNEHSECPVINTLVMTLGENNLWSEVLGCSAKSVCLIRHHLGEAQIYKYAVTVRVNKNVLGL